MCLAIHNGCFCAKSKDVSSGVDLVFVAGNGKRGEPVAEVLHLPAVKASGVVGPKWSKNLKFQSLDRCSYRYWCLSALLRCPQLNGTARVLRVLKHSLG